MTVVAAPALHSATVSDVLRDLTRGDEEMIHVEEVIKRLGERGFGPVLLTLGVPQLAPLPPGTPLIFALPLFFVCVQMIAGRKTLWLPRFISKHQLSKAKLAKLMDKVTPWMDRVERHVHPRLSFMVEGVGERIAGVTCTLVAIVLVLPVPFANLVPSMAITAFGLALARKDGVMAILGYGLVVASVAVIWFCLYLVSIGWHHLSAHGIWHWPLF